MRRNSHKLLLTACAVQHRFIDYISVFKNYSFQYKSINKDTSYYLYSVFRKQIEIVTKPLYCTCFTLFPLWQFLQTPSTPLWPGPSLKTPGLYKILNVFWSVFELNNFKDANNLANKRRAALKTMGLLPVPTKEEYIDEEELAPENDVEGPIIEHIVGGCCSDPGDVAGCSSYVKGIRTSCLSFVSLNQYCG